MKTYTRLISLVLLCVILVGFLSLRAKAAKAPEVYIGGVGLYDGDYLAAGAYQTTQTKPEDYYAYYSAGVLTLHNFSYTGPGKPVDIHEYPKERRMPSGRYFAMTRSTK